MNPQKFFLYSAGLFLLVLTVIISASGGVITVNVNLNLTLPPSLEGDIVSEVPSYHYSIPPPVEDYPRSLPSPPDDEFLYPPNSEKYNEFDWSPMVPSTPKSKGEGEGSLKPKPRGLGAPFGGPPIRVEMAPSAPHGRTGFF